MKLLNRLVVLCAVLFLPFANVYAHSGCCSQHGGVAGCNNASGLQQCKDGSTSPTCACDGSTVKETKVKKETKAQKMTKEPKAKTTKVQKTKTVKTETAVPATAAAATAASYKTTGCCSGHGGVASCNSSTGFLKCKDGSHSTTCACPKKKSKR